MALQVPNRDGRVFVGKGPAPNSKGEWNLDRFCTHIRGRGDATIEILIGVAVLRKLGILKKNEAVSEVGAYYQDWKGTAEFPRAHRFPCNPLVGGRNIPDIPHSEKLKKALIEPLAITDFLTFEVNYADCRFEDLGGKKAAVDAVTFVLNQQPEAHDVSIDLVQHGVLNIALEGYKQAYRRASADVHARINQEGMVEMLSRNQRSIDKPRSPTAILESIQQVLYDMERFTDIVQPRRLLPDGIRHLASRLESLAADPSA
jgi:hypothetical protein